MSGLTRLPECGSLMVEEGKVVDYLLNLAHPQGGPKARYFRNRGFTGEAWQVMAEAHKQRGATQPVTASATNKHGAKFEVQCQIVTPDGTNPCILTAWIQEGDRPPRLVTAHPNT